MPNKVLSATALATALAVSSPASADVPSPVSYDVRDTISGSVNNVTNNGVIPLTQEVKFGNTIDTIIDAGVAVKDGSPETYRLGVTLIPTDTPFVFKIDGERSSLLEKALIAAGYTISDKGYVLLGASQVREYNEAYQKNINGGSIFGKGVINLDKGTIYIDIADQNVKSTELARNVTHSTSTKNKDFTNYTEITKTSVDTTTTTEGKGDSWMYTRAGVTHDIGDQSRIDLHYLQLDQQKGWGVGVKNWFPDQKASLNTTYEHDGFGNPVSVELQKGISKNFSVGAFTRVNTQGKSDTTFGLSLTGGFGNYARPDTTELKAINAAHDLTTGDGVVPSNLYSKLKIVTTSVDHIVSQDVTKIEKIPKLTVNTNSVIVNENHTVTFTVNSDFPVAYSYRIDGGNVVAISGKSQNLTITTEEALSEGLHTIDVQGTNGIVKVDIPVVVNIVHTNHAPVGVDSTYDTAYDTSVVLSPLTKASDLDGDSLSASATSSDGTLVNNPDGTIIFTPKPGFSGKGIVSVIIDDGKGGKAKETITVNVGTKPVIYTDAPTTVVLGATNITSSSLLAQCNITDLDGVSGTCVVKDTSGTMIHQSVIGADVLIQNLTPNTTYILEITGTANKKNSDGTLTSTPIHQVKNIQTIDVAPIDHPESLILPTLTIGTTKVSFAGGSVTDTDNPSGFLTNIQYIVHDGSGNTVNPTQLIPNSLYTYTIQYDTKNGANGQTVTKTSAVVSFRTLALSTPPAPTFSVDDDINTINWNGQVSSDYEVSFDNGKTYSAVPTNFGSGVVAVWLRKKAVLNVSNPSPVEILTFTQNNTPGTLSAISVVSQKYSVTFSDPDGVSGVTATLDGVSITVSQSGATYSVSLPTNTAAGSHVLKFSAQGKKPDGTLEAVQTVSKTIDIAAPDPAPIAAGAFANLNDITLEDNGGTGMLPIDAGGVTDSLGRSIEYTASGGPTGMTIDKTTGVIDFHNYDASQPEFYTITITAKAVISKNPLVLSPKSISKTFVLRINNNA